MHAITRQHCRVSVLTSDLRTLFLSGLIIAKHPVFLNTFLKLYKFSRSHFFLTIKNLSGSIFQPKYDIPKDFGRKLRVIPSLKYLGRLAQLARALARQARGHWFEPSIAHHRLVNHVSRNSLNISDYINSLIVISTIGILLLYQGKIRTRFMSRKRRCF